MTKGQLERVFRLWQSRLGLERWRIEFRWDELCGPDSYAEIEKSSYYDTAKVRLEPDWSKWSPEFAEQILVHELVHALHRDVDEAWNDLEGQLQQTAWLLANRRYRHAMEGFVDRMASRLVELGGG